MKNIEPKVYRQRLIIEGHFEVPIEGENIKAYLTKLSKVLKMTIFSGPFCWPPDKWTNPRVKLHNLNAFVAWTKSGCHVYAWRLPKFFTADIYSCKPFNTKKVLKFTKDFFKSKDMVYKEI